MIGVVLAAVALVLGLFWVAGGDGDGDGDQTVDVSLPEAAPPTDLPAADAPPATTPVVAPPTTLESTTLAPTTTTDPGFTLAEGEIFLEPAASEGPDSFAGELFGGEPATTPPGDSTTPPELAPDASGPTPVSAVVGDTPGLYGGTRNNAVCDKERQLLFLQENGEKAAAFVEALNSDPSLMWNGGPTLSVTQLPDYFAELTPMVLTRDTRVTNHGYRDGRPTSRQVVLQAGTAVLVDRYGVPRARCLCGNPLTAPQPVPVAPVYTGPSWPDFSPITIVVINQTTIVIDVFVLVDVMTGGEFVRPWGSDGVADAPSEASVWQVDVTAVLAEVDYFNTTTTTWSGDFTIAADGVITGSGAGSWTFDADCYESGGSVQSTSSAQGTYSVTLAGQVFYTELGRFVTVVPTYSDFAIGSYSGTPPVTVCEQDVYDHVESWVSPAFTTIELMAEGDVVLASYESNGFVGDVTLTPIGWASSGLWPVPTVPDAPGVTVGNPFPVPGESFWVEVVGCPPGGDVVLELGGRVLATVSDGNGASVTTLTAPETVGDHAGSVACGGVATAFLISTVAD